VWDQLRDADVDVALLQEAPPPPEGWSVAVVPDPAGGWHTDGWDPDRWRRRTAVVAASSRVRLDPWRLHGLDAVHQAGLVESRAGTLAAADVHVEGETITLVSVYAAWEPDAHTPPRMRYADAAAHRLLSDISGLLTGRRDHRVIAAGDLNILNRYGEHHDTYWAGRYASVFDRADALGLAFVGPQAPNGHQANPPPPELPDGSRDVPTFRARRGDPASATRQIDFVFATPTLADRLTVRALNSNDEWGTSDHCRIEIDLHPPS